MIITCPHCRTRYKVAADAIGAAGRQVQCATCHEAWMAGSTPAAPPEPDPAPDGDEMAFLTDPDTLFSQADEALLDSAFEAEAQAQTAEEAFPSTPTTPDEDPAGAPDHPHRRQALARRRRVINRSMPMARFRRSIRLAVAGVLVAILVGSVAFRTDIVRAFPEFGLLYKSIGLGTNIVGLDFYTVKTLRTTRDGIDVLMVTATILNVTNRTLALPPVLVSLINDDNGIVYEWSVTPAARDILPGDTASIETQLTAPPKGVERVQLTFAYGQNRLDAVEPAEPR